MDGLGLIRRILGLTLVLCYCQGQIISQPDGKSFTFLKRSTVNITWATKIDLSKITYRGWFFTSSDGVFNGHRLGRINDDDPPSDLTSLFDVAIEKPATLVLKNVNQSYDGAYKFQFAGPGGGGSKSVVIFIARKPNVTLNCSSPVTLNEGDDFTCLCKGEGGRPPANVTWYKDGVKISDVGTENQTINLLNVGGADNGTYICVATSYPHGNYTDKKSVKVTVYSMLNVTLDCSSPVTLNEGDDFRCSCKGEGGNLPANVTWYKDGEKISDIGTGNQTLKLLSVNRTENGSYSCVATSYHHKSYTREKQSIQVIVLWKPNVTLTCSSPVTLNEGDDFTCLCKGEGGNPPADVTWYKDGVKISDVGKENQILNLLRVGRANLGTYKCVATSFPHKNYTEEKSIQVIVLLKPAVTLNCPSLVTLKEGDNFGCLCKGEGGNPPADVTWYKDGVKVSDVGAERQTLNLLNIDRTDHGTYKCVASSKSGEKYTDEKFTQLIIVFKPTNTVIRFSENPAAIIGSTTVTCTSDGFPEPIYTIYHNDTKVVGNKRYTITQVKWEDAGTYRCIATNAVGEYSVYDYLNVMEKTKPTRSTSPSLSSTSVTNSGGNETEKADPAVSNDSETKWYIVVVILVSGIIIGVLFSYIFVRSRRRFKRAQQSNPKPPTSQVDLTYQELDLKKMNTENNYQYLTVNAAGNDGVNNDESTYTDLTKTRDVENNYHSLT